MAAERWIVAYLVLWMSWGALVGVILEQRPGRPELLDVRSCSAILTFALAPVLALSLAAYYTRWIPGPVNEVLSLATPPALMLFVVQQVQRLLVRASEGAEGTPGPS
jgi:hypothetical protein